MMFHTFDLPVTFTESEVLTVAITKGKDRVSSSKKAQMVLPDDTKLLASLYSKLKITYMGNDSLNLR